MYTIYKSTVLLSAIAKLSNLKNSSKEWFQYHSSSDLHIRAANAPAGGFMSSDDNADI